MDKTTQKTIVVAHTHWDREWYMPFTLFRFRLVAMMDRLLDILERDPSFTSFMLDGQACMLEDYLEIRPAARPRIEALARAGRIIIGPFHVQNSPWLQTGEGYVKNLLFGHSIAREFGVPAMKVAYIPDQFVHFEQMPQVFRGFGIKAMAFSRGMGNQQEEHGLGFEFEWIAPDGSSIMALHLVGGYGQGSGMPEDPMAAVDMLVFAKGKINAIKKATRWNLLFCGDDHRVPEHVLPRAIETWNAIEEIVEDEGTVELGTMERFVDAVLAEAPALPRYAGEIRGARYNLAFQGVFSSCMPLKQANFAVHAMLEKQAEPLAALAKAIAGSDYSGFLKEAWEQLLLNQPHDSSWTASWDPVMDEMETRFGWAMQGASEVRNWALLDLASRVRVPAHSDKQVEIVVFNPLEFDRREPVSVTVPVNFHVGDGYVLLDGSGNHVASMAEPLVMANDEIHLVRKFVGSHGPRPSTFYRLHVDAVDVPALGYTTLFLFPAQARGAGSPATSPTLVASDQALENDVISVVAGLDGSFTITDKRTGHAFTGLNVFEDTSDAGDGYEFKTVNGDVPVSSKACQARIVPGRVAGRRAWLEIVVPMQVPSGLNDDCTARGKDLVPLDVTTTISIEAGKNPRVDVAVSFDNQAVDHRLSCTFPTGLHADVVEVDGHFGITTRPVDLPDSKGWSVAPVAQAPQHRYINVRDKSRGTGLAIVNRGLPEYEATRDADGTVRLGLTLMRSVGGWGTHINKNSPVTVVHPRLRGKHVYEYAIIPHEGLPPGKLHRAALAYYYPVHAEYRGAHNKYQGYFPNIPAPEPFLATSASFFKLEPDTLVLSILKEAENGDGIIVRVFNLSRSETIKGRLETGLRIASVEQVSLEEQPVDGTLVELAGSLDAIVVVVPPSKIVTLLLKLA